MNVGEASDLAVRIHQTWRNGPTADVWEDELRTLEFARACTTYVKLRREKTTAPSVAEFVKTYRTVNTIDGSNYAPTCETCSGVGWVTGPDFVDRGHTYTSATPCTCEAGRRASNSTIWKEAQR
jgi:hypothetical protein